MKRRSEAWERFSTSSVPTESEEVWRYSGIDAFDLDGYEPARARPGGEGSEPALAVARRLADSLGRRAGLVVTRNGVIEAIEITESAPEALSVAGARGSAVGASAPDALGMLAPARDAFGELHDAFVSDVVLVRVPPKTVVADPVIVVHLIDPGVGSAPGVSVFPHTLAQVGTSAEAGIIELIAPGAVGGALPAGDEVDVTCAERYGRAFCSQGVSTALTETGRSEHGGFDLLVGAEQLQVHGPWNSSRGSQCHREPPSPGYEVQPLASLSPYTGFREPSPGTVPTDCGGLRRQSAGDPSG